MNYRQFEQLVDLSTWQSFEEITGKIFEYHGFEITISKTLTKNKKRRQFDVIAQKGNSTITVDCKRWDKNRYKTAALKTAAEKQIERTNLFFENAKPIIVTRFSESIYSHKDVQIVPIEKLNTFIFEAL